MMEVPQHDVMFRSKPQKPDPKEWPLLQIKRLFPLVSKHCIQLFSLCRLLQTTQIFKSKINRMWRSNDLRRLVVDHLEARAQHFMSCNNSIQRSLQRLCVQAAPEVISARQVVLRAPALHLINEPQPLLRVGQWQDLGTFLT